MLELFNFFSYKMLEFCFNDVTMWNIFLLVKKVHLTIEKSSLQNRWRNCYTQTNTASEYKGAQEGPGPPDLLKISLAVSYGPLTKGVWICTLNVDVLWKPNIGPKWNFCNVDGMAFMVPHPWVYQPFIYDRARAHKKGHFGVIRAFSSKVLKMLNAIF